MVDKLVKSLGIEAEKDALVGKLRNRQTWRRDLWGLRAEHDVAWRFESFLPHHGFGRKKVRTWAPAGVGTIRYKPLVKYLQ